MHKRKLKEKIRTEQRKARGLPPLTTMAKNITLSLVNVIRSAGKGGGIVASSDTIQKRINICKSCEHAMSKNRCKICGCFLDVKTGLKTESCPLDKW